MAAQVHGSCQDHHLIALAEHFSIRASVPSQAEMGVSINQTGGQAGCTQINRLRLWGKVLAKARSRTHVNNTSTRDQYRLGRLYWPTKTVKESLCLNQDAICR
jgi:hypothetical protein